ncbi:hypothetical protein FZC75_16035 [Sutcliffiella horikoshii]|uniref:Uncharacterized protein n=1 Tax=Sutcliffiella horikoshii TaxID=79883 RepID=A0A5D4T5F1_9BACI|nr:hypothetical protein FZC75_16035 [Sutcliffiella horikoshii]
MEQKVKTPEGDSARWRPRRLAEEAPAAPLGKRSHLRKGTAALNQISKIFSTYSNSPVRLRWFGTLFLFHGLVFAGHR